MAKYTVTSGSSNVKLLSSAASVVALTPAQHQGALELQRERQIANQAQQEYFYNLTHGNVSTAEALLNPRTEQKHFNNSQSVDVSGTSINLPQFIAEAGYDVTQPEVIPNSLFAPQPINVTGQSKNSTMNYGVNTNANLNYAATMNDYQSANPNSSINHGLLVNPAYFTAGLSSTPQDNDTHTVLLGGNTQRQETDVNTNMENTPPLSQQSESNVNWAQSFSLGSAVIPLAILSGLYFLGKKK